MKGKREREREREDRPWTLCHTRKSRNRSGEGVNNIHRFVCACFDNGKNLLGQLCRGILLCAVISSFLKSNVEVIVLYARRRVIRYASFVSEFCIRCYDSDWVSF